jgi:hypothetical protein
MLLFQLLLHPKLCKKFQVLNFYSNDIEAGLFGRHVMGRWRNVNDRYFYGFVHLAVLPGETVLDGYYTAVLTDSRVTSLTDRAKSGQTGSLVTTFGDST